MLGIPGDPDQQLSMQSPGVEPALQNPHQDNQQGSPEVSSVPQKEEGASYPGDAEESGQVLQYASISSRAQAGEHLPTNLCCIPVSQQAPLLRHHFHPRRIGSHNLY